MWGKLAPVSTEIAPDEMRGHKALIELLAEITRSIVSRPDLVRITCAPTGARLRIHIESHADDLALLTGRTLRSLQTVVATCAKIRGYTLERLQVVEFPEDDS